MRQIIIFFCSSFSNFEIDLLWDGHKIVKLFNAKVREKSDTFIALDSECSENLDPGPIP